MTTALQDIAARYQRLNEAVSKGTLSADDTAILSNKYAYPVGNSALGMSQTRAAEVASANEADCYVPFTISTQQVDSDGDVVVSLGAELDEFAGNEVIFFGHQSWQIPLGLARKGDGPLCVWPQDYRVQSGIYFDKPDPDAMFVYGKVMRGILKAASVTFIPVAADRREKAHVESMSPVGWTFHRWKLKEWSIVGIGANAGALRDSLDQEKSFITPRLSKALAPYAAQARGCFSGYCPCPPCEESDMSVKQNAATLTSGLPGAKKCHKSSCRCKKCIKAMLPEQANAKPGSEAAGVHEERNEHQEEHAEEQKSELEQRVAAKIPKLRDEGYPEHQAVAIAYHMAGEKQLEGDDITGHEEIARALGYRKDDMGGGSGTQGGYAEEEMSLKSFVKAMKEEDDPEEETPKAGAEEEKPAEGEAEQAEAEPAEEYKHSVKVLGGLHNHMQKAHEWLSGHVAKMDHAQIAKAMGLHCKELAGHMESYKALAEHHHPDVDFEKMCKSLESGETEMDENETGTNAGQEATSQEDHGSTDESARELIEEYQHPKSLATKQESELAERINRFADRVDQHLFPIAGFKSVG